MLIELVPVVGSLIQLISRLDHQRRAGWLRICPNSWWTHDSFICNRIWWKYDQTSRNVEYFEDTDCAHHSCIRHQNVRLISQRGAIWNTSQLIWSVKIKQVSHGTSVNTMYYVEFGDWTRTSCRIVNSVDIVVEPSGARMLMTYMSTSTMNTW